MLRRALLTLFCILSSAIRADDSKPDDIEFDTAAYSFPCRDKTPKEFAEANPDRKIIEASIRVSANFNLGEDQVDRIEYKLKMPESFEISDYLPKTTIGSEVVGQIGVGRQNTARAMTVVSLDAGAKAGFQIPFVTDAEAKASRARKDEDAKEIGSNVQMNLLPPKELITSASTQDAGRTLHFKLKQYNQITLQGDRDFAFLAAVPRDWKGDCFTLECTAFFKGLQNAATKRAVRVGLYINGDLATKKRVEAIAKAHRPTVSTTRTIVLPSTPDSKTNPALPASDPFLKKYAGKYSLYNGFGFTFHLDLGTDGTFIGKGRGKFNETNVKGTWSAAKDVLVITVTYNSTPFGVLTHPMEIVNSKIFNYDKTTRVIRTESKHELKPESE